MASASPVETPGAGMGALRFRPAAPASGVKGLNALLATVSTPLAAPVIAGCRLRKGATNSARGASRLLADALVTARAAGASGLVIVRADSAFYNRDVLAPPAGTARGSP